MKMNKFQADMGRLAAMLIGSYTFAVCVCPVYANPKENSPCNDSARTSNQMNKLNASGNILPFRDRALKLMKLFFVISSPIPKRHKIARTRKLVNGVSNFKYLQK
jgi:hypothetical protein